MQSVQIKVHGKIEADGHLRLDVTTPLAAGDAEVTLTIQADNGSARYDFSSLAGRLSWSGDAVAEQRRLRNEW